MLLWIQVGHNGQRMYRFLFRIFNKRSKQTVNHLNTVYFEQLFCFKKTFFYYIYIQVMQLLLACLDGFVGEECDTPCVYPSYGRNCGFICNCMGCLQGKHYFKIKSE